MKLQEVMEKKRRGDLLVASQMLGIKMQYASKILRRPTAELHKPLLDALAKVISNREALLKDVKKGE